MIDLSNVEKEIILLKATWEIINSAVNNVVFNPKKSDLFKTLEHQRYFGVLIIDLLSKPSGFSFVEKYVQELKNIYTTPNFNNDNSIANLTTAVNNIQNWLKQPVPLDEKGHYADEPMWFPSIEKSINPRFLREDIIFIYGNMSKHKFTQLTSVTNKIKCCFKKAGKEISEIEALLVLNDLHEHLDDNIFIFHAHHMAKHMNHIIWGIYDYLLPEFQKSIQYIGQNGRYKYTIPKGVSNNYTKNIYWELMNDVRSKPYIEKFNFAPDDLRNFYEVNNS